MTQIPRIFAKITWFILCFQVGIWFTSMLQFDLFAWACVSGHVCLYIAARSFAKQHNSNYQTKKENT